MGTLCAKKPPEDPTPDPITGLTQRQRILLRESWKTIIQKSTIKDVGAKLLIKLFRRYPHMINYYKDLTSLDISELKNSANFRAHAVSTILSISAYVECTDEPEILRALMHKHAVLQYKAGFTIEDNSKLKDVTLDFVKEECDTDTLLEVMDAWEQLTQFQLECYKAKYATMKSKPINTKSSSSTANQRTNS